MSEPTAMELLIQRLVSEPLDVAENQRKVVQIAATANHSGNDILYALANDGTLWRMAPQLIDSDWRRIKDIPNE